MIKDALEYIRESHRQAERDAEGMRAALARKDRAAFNRALRDYLLSRFSLTSEQAGAEQDIEELARISLIAQRGKRAVAESDKAINCTNASSAEEKTLLFILVVQRGVGAKLAPAVSAQIQTLPQLAEALWNASFPRE